MALRSRPPLSMAPEQVNAAEIIGPEEILYRRLNRFQFDPVTDEVSSAAFSNLETSVNWAKYSTPETTAAPDSLAICQIVCSDCKNCGQDVIHDPLKEGDFGFPNPAHSLINGHKKQSTRRKLRDLSKVIWRSPTPTGP